MKKPAYSFRVVWSDEDKEYVATSPEFSGVSGLGRTPQRAIAEAQSALDLALETYAEQGWPIPAPATLSEYSGQFRLRVPTSLHALLVQRAADEGVSLNTYAVTLLASGIASDPVTRYSAKPSKSRVVAE